MPFTHHSHSGQFCHHGKNTLEEMVKAAVDKGYLMICLTEHIPRSREDFYPEEVSGKNGQYSLSRVTISSGNVSA